MRHLARSSRSLGLVSLVVAAATMSCSLLVDTGTRTQCQTSDDCDANPLWRGRVCELGFCAIKQEDPGVVSKDPDGCISTDNCTYTRNAGRASLCRKVGTPCLVLEDDGAPPRCPNVTGGDAWKNEDVIMIGSIEPRTFTQASGDKRTGQYAERVSRAMDLAVEQFNEKTGNGLQMGTKRRPLSVLHCDSQGDGATALARFDFLVNQVGVKALIVGWNEDFRAIAKAAADKNIAVVCSDCQTPFPAPTFPLQPWKIFPSIGLDAALGAWRVADLETKIKTANPAVTSLKVALVTEPFSVPRFYGEEIVKTLSFNGKSAANNGSNFVPMELEDPRVNVSKLTENGLSLASMAPNVIVLAMGEAAPKLITVIEDAWPQDKPKPFYVLTFMNYEASLFTDLLVLGRELPVGDAGAPDPTSLRFRLSGTHPRINGPRQSNLDLFNAAYRSHGLSDPDGSESGYEALLAMGYAIAAASPLAQDGEIDGPRINAGFSKLIGGPGSPVVDFNAGQLATGIPYVLSQPINVRGITTELDWDPVTHEVEAEMSMYCFVRVKDGDSSVVVLKEAGDVVYSPATKTVTGTYACPPDFQE